MSKIAYLNYQYIKFNKAKVHIEDRGLQFSDSVYEIISVFNNKFIDFNFHIKNGATLLRENIESDNYEYED